MGLTRLKHGNGLYDVKIELDSHHKAMLGTLEEAINRCRANSDLRSPESATTSLAIEARLIAQYYEVMAHGISKAEAMDVAYCEN